MITKELLDYIKIQLAQGKNENEIKQALLTGGGWSHSDVAEAMKYVLPNQPPVSTVSELRPGLRPQSVAGSQFIASNFSEKKKSKVGIVVLVTLLFFLSGGGVFAYLGYKGELGEFSNMFNKMLGRELVTDIEMKENSNGDETPIMVVDEEVLSDLVVERYGENEEYVRKLIKAKLLAMGANYMTQAYYLKNSDGGFSGACDFANSYFSTEVENSLNSGDALSNQLAKELGITAESYRVNEMSCVSDDENFVLTIPLTLEDGTESNMCVSENGAVAGIADFDNFNCIKNTI